MYDKEYLQSTLTVLKDNLDDLARWSVFNGDKALDEIYELTIAFNKVKKALEGGETQ